MKKQKTQQLFSLYSECIKEMYPFTRYFWLLSYAQFTYDANLQRPVNMKDYAELKDLGDQLSSSSPYMLFTTAIFFWEACK